MSVPSRKGGPSPRRANTRRLLVAAADRLIRTQGYEATTLEQICAEANVHVRTIHRYFPSKEHVLLANQYDALARFRAAILADDRGDAVTFWRSFVEGEARRTEQQPLVVEHLRLVMSIPAVAPRWTAIIGDFEEVLAGVLAEEADATPEAVFRGRLLAVLLVGGTAAVVRDWAADGYGGDLAAHCLHAIDYAVERFPLVLDLATQGRTR